MCTKPSLLLIFYGQNSEDRQEGERGARSCATPGTGLDSQLMMTISIMVTVKKAIGATSTLTKMAVSRNTPRMTDRHPQIRSFWEILGGREGRKGEGK